MTQPDQPADTGPASIRIDPATALADWNDPRGALPDYDPENPEQTAPGTGEPTTAVEPGPDGLAFATGTATDGPTVQDLAAAGGTVRFGVRDGSRVQHASTDGSTTLCGRPFADDRPAHQATQTCPTCLGLLAQPIRPA